MRALLTEQAFITRQLSQQRGQYSMNQRTASINVCSIPAATEGVPTAAAKEHVKDVHGVHASASPGSALLDALLAGLVVQLPLLGV